MPNCKQCGSAFEISGDDLTYYEKVKAISPALCVDCRLTRMMVWRNERTFYPAKCKKCGSGMVSSFSGASPLNIFCNKCWWGDDVNPLDYGRDFDFSKPFFEQYWELMKAVPVGNLFQASCENSEYSTYSVGNKNCYMSGASDHNQDSFYLDNSNFNRDVGDVSMVNKSELVYEGVDLTNSYMCLFSQNLTNCNFCFACADLIGCSNCVGCVGLRNAQYFIFNRKYSKADYEKEIERMALGSHSNAERILERFAEFRLTQPRKFSNNLNSESCSGDHILNSKQCKNCFDILECDTCENLFFGYKSRDSRDGYGIVGGELCYCTVATVESYNVQFCSLIWPGSSNLYYSAFIRNAKNCFGCVSLRHNEFCILNKQYTPEGYAEMMTKIHAHMVQTGEWGQYFPMQFAPWSYNETVAMDFAPRAKEEAQALGARWEEKATGAFGKGTMMHGQMPDDIKKATDAVLDEILECSCGRNFKIIKQELDFYRKIGVSLPRKCPSCRYRARMSLRTPRKLWKRKCIADGCANEFETSYAPDRKDIIYCEDCYRKVAG